MNVSFLGLWLNLNYYSLNKFEKLVIIKRGGRKEKEGGREKKGERTDRKETDRDKSSDIRPADQKQCGTSMDDFNT